MSTQRSDRVVHDYVDGRLAPAERESFEARLRGDRDLAARVERYREIRRALRDPTAELSPGFYTRTRARFEERSGAAARSGMFGLSWAGVGLATAALATAALFLPAVIRRDVSPPSVSPPSVESGKRDAGPTAQVAPEALELEERAYDDQKGKIVGEMSAPAAPRRDSPAADEVAPLEARKAQAGPSGREGRRDRENDVGTRTPPPRDPLPEPVMKQEAAVPPAPRPSSDRQLRQDADTAPTTAKRGMLRERTRLESPAAELEEAAIRETDAPDAFADEAASYRAGVRSAELPRGAVEIGAVQSLGGAAWHEALGGAFGPALTSLGDPEAERRLILIGPRAGLDCAALSVASSATEHRIFQLAPGSRQTDGGCALVLPRDGLPVHVWIPEGAP